MKDNILNNMQILDKFSLDGIEPNMIELRNLNKPILTIHADGRITVAEHLKPTETAAEVLKILQDMWLSNQQVVKIKELQERIKRLEEAGDAMEAWLRDERLNAVQYTVSKWRKAKEAKP
jgi:uncharacterized protein Yka (UPF0111/DUF47 family)